MIIVMFGQVGSGKSLSAVYEVYQLAFTCKHCKHTAYHGRTGFYTLRYLLQKKELQYHRHVTGQLTEDDYEHINIELLVAEIAHLKRVRWMGEDHCYHPNGCSCTQEENYRVYSNIKLNFPYIPIDTKLFKQFKKNRALFKDAVILIDEIHIWMDSRDSMKKRVKQRTYFILQSRKVSLRLFATTQHPSQMDKRLRNTADMYVKCTNLSNKTSTVIEGMPTIIMNEYMMQYDENEVTRVRYLNGNNIFPLYDTTEIVDTEDDEEDGLELDSDVENDATADI